MLLWGCAVGKAVTSGLGVSGSFRCCGAGWEGNPAVGQVYRRDIKRYGIVFFVSLPPCCMLLREHTVERTWYGIAQGL